MNAPNWEVRRTAAFLLREFGGAEGLKELQPLLTDTEPLVQREAIQALVLNGSDAASQILLQRADDDDRPPARDADQRAGWRCATSAPAPLFCYLVRQLDRTAVPGVYVGAIEALGSFGGPDAVEALKDALQQGDWWAPLRTRRDARGGGAGAARDRHAGRRRRRCARRIRGRAAPRGVRAARRMARARTEVGIDA